MLDEYYNRKYKLEKELEVLEKEILDDEFGDLARHYVVMRESLEEDSVYIENRTAITGESEEDLRQRIQNSFKTRVKLLAELDGLKYKGMETINSRKDESGLRSIDFTSDITTSRNRLLNA